jgi:hypothetical protein
MLGLTPKNGDLLFAALSLGYVAGNFRCADDFAGRISDRGYGQRNIGRASVLADTDGFIVIDALATSDLLQNLGFFLVAVRWNQDRDGLRQLDVERATHLQEVPHAAAGPQSW